MIRASELSSLGGIAKATFNSKEPNAVVLLREAIRKLPHKFHPQLVDMYYDKTYSFIAPCLANLTKTLIWNAQSTHYWTDECELMKNMAEQKPIDTVFVKKLAAEYDNGLELKMLNDHSNSKEVIPVIIQASCKCYLGQEICIKDLFDQVLPHIGKLGVIEKNAKERILSDGLFNYLCSEYGRAETFEALKLRYKNTDPEDLVIELKSAKFLLETTPVTPRSSSICPSSPERTEKLQFYQDSVDIISAMLNTH